MQLYQFRRVNLITFLLVSVMLPAAVAAQEVSKRVLFKKGQSSATFRGKLPRGHSDYDSYLLKARKGQTITVKLTCADPRAAFAIYELNELGPDEDTVSAPNKSVRQFTGKLPVTSEYSVQVYGVIFGDSGESSQAPYSLEISVTGRTPDMAKRPELPAGLRYVGDDYFLKDLLKLPAFTTRIKVLLGKRYSDFLEATEINSKVERSGDFLMTSGFARGLGTIYEAALAIDLKNDRIHAVIYSLDSATFFNEDKEPNPKILLDWVRELKERKGR